MPRRVSWIRLWCVPKPQRDWHSSINPTSSAALYPNNSGFPFSFCSTITGEDERKSHGDCSLNLLLQTEINLCHLSPKLLCRSLTLRRASFNPIPLLYHSISFCLPLFPFLSHISAIPLQPCTADVSRQEALCTSVHYK